MHRLCTVEMKNHFNCTLLLFTRKFDFKQTPFTHTHRQGERQDIWSNADFEGKLEKNKLLTTRENKRSVLQLKWLWMTVNPFARFTINYKKKTGIYSVIWPECGAALISVWIVFELIKNLMMADDTIVIFRGVPAQACVRERNNQI